MTDTCAGEAPTVAVLLASYNGARFIADQISTIVNQSGIDVRIHVRDDGSSDETMAVVHRLANGNPSIAVVDAAAPPTGSAARNFLRMLSIVDFGDAEYIALADQDDLWLSGKLSRAIERLRASGAAGYSCNLAAFDDAGRRAPWLLLKHGPQKSFDHLFQGASAGCTYVLTRACAEALRTWLATCTYPQDMGISHDWMIYAFVRNRGLGWYCDDVASILYRQHGGNVYGSQRGLADILGRVRLLRERWYRRHILWLGTQILPSPAEREVLERVARMSLVDRVWLIARAGRLRRRPRDTAMLRLSMIAGLF